MIIVHTDKVCTVILIVKNGRYFASLAFDLDPEGVRTKALFTCFQYPPSMETIRVNTNATTMPYQKPLRTVLKMTIPPIEIPIRGIMLYIQRQAYQSDLKGQEWKWLKKFLPNPSTVGTRGRPQEWPPREIINAILYLLRTGCQ